jgi:hypothetical protein
MLVRVTVCAALVVPTVCELNVRVPGVRATAGEDPVPRRLTVCGLPAALSLIDTLAVTVVVSVGENVTLIVQLAPLVSVAGQLFVSPY